MFLFIVRDGVYAARLAAKKIKDLKKLKTKDEGLFIWHLSSFALCLSPTSLLNHLPIGICIH